MDIFFGKSLHVKYLITSEKKIWHLKYLVEFWVVHTSSQMAVGLSAWTSNMTHIGSKYNYGRSIFCENKNHFAGSFGDSCQHAQPILPIFGGFFCLCTTGPPKLPAKIFLFSQKMNLRTLYFKPIIAKTLVHKLYPTAIWDEVWQDLTQISIVWNFCLDFER